jgi:hypothetical protein
MSQENIPVELRGTEAAWRTAAAACKDKLAGSAIPFLPCDGDWVNSAVEVAKGQAVTLLATGQVWLSREANLAFGPNVALWYRIGDGPIARCPANTGSFVADHAGALRLITKPPGEWADSAGNFLADYPHQGASGGLLIAVLAWTGNADAGLEAFAAKDSSGTGEAERARHAARKPLPAGWQPLWRIGLSDVFREEAEPDGRRAIICRCNNDVAILKYPLDVPLNETTRMTWSWRIDQLPSAVTENTTATHDYLSLAVEFENGQDLTYLWSSSLPVGAAFRCPLSWWDQHETHMVLRSGALDLGRWTSEEQSVLRDYEKAVGGKFPERIIGVWLIAVSAFQRQSGHAAYRDLQLKASEGAVRIGP